MIKYLIKGRGSHLQTVLETFSEGNLDTKHGEDGSHHPFIPETQRAFRLPGTEGACFWGWHRIKEDRVPAPLPSEVREVKRQPCSLKGCTSGSFCYRKPE